MQGQKIRELILKIITQRNNNFSKNILVFLIYNFISTNKMEVDFCFSPLSGPNKNCSNKKTRIFLMKLLFRCLIAFKIRSLERRDYCRQPNLKSKTLRLKPAKAGAPTHKISVVDPYNFPDPDRGKSDPDPSLDF